MKITKYPQSHLVIEKDNKKLVIDPGNYTFDKGFSVSEFQNADAYLITHLHDDHVGYKTIKELVNDKPVYGNNETVAKLKDLGVEGIEIKDQEEIEVAGFKIKSVEIPHFHLDNTPPMPKNSGFLIDGVLFDSGDSVEIKAEVTAQNAALPIGHSAISFNDVYNAARSLGAKVIIPIHYDAYFRDPEELKKVSHHYNFGFDIRALKDGEETEIN